MNPPKDVAASDLFRKLLERPRPSEVVELPAYWNGETPPKVRIVVLRDDEYDDARVFAAKKVQDTYKDGGTVLDDAKKLIEKDWITRYLISRAVRYKDPIEGTEGVPGGPEYPHVFHSPESVKQALHREELDVLASQYFSVQSKFGPIERLIHTQEEVSEWVQRIAEGSDALPLSRLGSQDLAALLQSISDRVYVLSQILGSLRSTLPDSLSALLDAWHIGTSYYGEDAASIIATRYGLSLSKRKKGDTVVIAKEPAMPREPLTMASAAKLAHQLGGFHDDSS